MLLLLAMLAAGGSATMAPPRLLDEPITLADYPKQAKRSDDWGFARYRMTVSPEGLPVDCEIVTSTTFQDLDDATCKLAMKRAHYQPATGPDGQPAFGVAYHWFAWRTGPHSEAPDPGFADLELHVAHLPPGHDAALTVPLTLDVAADGAVRRCQSEADTALRAYGETGCINVTKIGRVTPAREKGGRRVPSVQRFTVQFGVQ